MKRILITRGTVCGGVAVEAGELVEASDQDAQKLVTLRKAVYAPTGERRKAAEPAPEIEAEPDPDPEPARVKRVKG